MLRDKLLSLLSKPQVISQHGLALEEIMESLDKEEIQYNAAQLRHIVNELKREESIKALPFKRQGIWYLQYYSHPRRLGSIKDRLEEIFTELAIPLWVKTRVFRGSKAIFVGELGKPPGFTIIDYNEDPPLRFNDKLAGGKPNEIVDYKRRSKYKCKKDERTIWYNYKGQRRIH